MGKFDLFGTMFIWHANMKVFEFLNVKAFLIHDFRLSVVIGLLIDRLKKKQDLLNSVGKK